MNAAPTASGTASGVEVDPVVGSASTSGNASLVIAPGHFRLIQANLRDQTDARAELLQESEWLLHTSETIELAGNAFAIENTLDGSGTVLLKLAPLPHARSRPSKWDVRIERGEKLLLSGDDGYDWARIPYKGGAWGRIAAVQKFQRSRRPFEKGRDGMLLTNTWGDRSRDAHLSPEFMLREIEAGARLGADVVQIDDGWQHGVTANSSKAKGGGSWNGFWASDPNFWSINRERFPNGLAPLVARAREKRMKFGLWFAPDTSNHGANWERDAGAILRMHRAEGIDFFKIDALKIESVEGEANLKKFFERVRTESGGRVTFDLDITAEKRFGYFGMMEAGPLFVENRYTDWRRYWPHHTLRVLWQLSHWIDPLRLRLEWLNNARNTDKYLNDPLAPSQWSPDALFATVMFASPLGWFEVQHLPSKYFEAAAPLISRWKQHREGIFNGTILPVGSAPDGRAWTGFVSIDSERRGGYALLFREKNPSRTFQLEVPLLAKKSGPVQVLGGKGSARLEGGALRVEVPEELGFVWVRL